jgi:superfamily II DNA or RNA helicase
VFNALQANIEAKLWKHQREAIVFAINHLKSFDSPCLIRMPTGTGKTGVIACLTRQSNHGSSLVLTPWAHLRNQMVADLATGFWQKIGVTPLKRDVVDLFPTTVKNVLKASAPQVIVATFATLNELRLDYSAEYDKLAAAISLVVVDEGHYEPAVEWKKSVTGLKAKTVLLTATPYRNDLKLFRITDSKKDTKQFTHKEAVADKIIRELRCETLGSDTDISSLSKAFAKAWKDAKKNNSLPSTAPRAIVCCAGHGDIETAVAELKKAGLKAVGVHEQFNASKDPNLLKDVPDDPKKRVAEIWVHQHKLTEGLDDHRFCCVALFTRIRNDRKLIQQIGRVLRKGAGDRKSAALLLAPADYSAEAEWEAYLEFETELELLEPKHFQKVVETLLNAQPKVEYFEGKFRRRFQPNALSAKPQVIISPSVLVRAAGKDFLLSNYVEDCTDTLNTEDAVILGSDINAPCQKSAAYALWVYASVRNSRLLQNTSLYEVTLETHCVVLAEGLVFITDSRGNLPISYLEEHTTILSPDQLGRFIDKKFRPTHVSVDSSIPYDTVLRGADLRGHNLLNVPASLTDRVQICRSAKGSSKDSRRYVGMINGRVRQEVSEDARRTFELKTFVQWAGDVARILKAKASGCALFERYMPTCAPPTNPVPKTICLDLLRHDLDITLADGSGCSLKSSSCDVVTSAKSGGNIYTCSFDVDGTKNAGKSVTLRIEYQPSKRRFWFNKHEGTSVRVSVDDDGKVTIKSLAEFLNQKQDIVLIGLEGGDIVYQGRHFYKIDYTYAEQALLGLIERPKNSPKCNSEKGSKDDIARLKKSKAKNFLTGTLFRAIADRKIGLSFDDDLLICADLGTECADFIAANFSEGQLALIHAKASDGKAISASAFHDVVAQAMKNLVYLTRNAEVPAGVNSWEPNGKWNKTEIQRVYRAPKAVPQKQALWKKIKSEIIENSTPQLFVVLVTTGCCDLDELKAAVNDTNKRTPEVAQLLHLLDGLNGYARQLGVHLLIRDLPFKEN